MEKAKILVKNKNWLIESNGTKIGSLNKDRGVYSFFRSGRKIVFKTLSELNEKLGFDLFSNQISLKTKSTDSYSVHEYPCDAQPHNAFYDVKQRLPLYTKNRKSTSYYCAGYYTIKKKRGWFVAYCPKQVILEKYPHTGPFKTQKEAENEL